MKKTIQKLSLLLLFLPLTALSQWVQLGETFESLNYNLEPPVAFDPNSMGGHFGSDVYGQSVSLSADGSIMAVGAPNAGGFSDYSKPLFGYVQVFRFVNGNWEQIGETLRTGDRDSVWPLNVSKYGTRVVLSDDGKTIAVSEPHWVSVEEDLPVRGGRVHVYQNISDQWVQIGAPITEYNELFFGEAMSMSADGSIVAVGNHKLDGGKVKTYRNISGTWVQLGSTLSEPWDGVNPFQEPLFGQEVTLSSDGMTLAVGMGGGGVTYTSAAEVRIFDLVSNDWVHTGTISGTSGTNFAQSISLSATGSRLVVSASLANSFRGRVSIYDKVGSNWVASGSITGSQSFELIGTHASLSDDGNVLAIASFPMSMGTSNPQVKIYRWDGAAWVQHGDFHYAATHHDNVSGDQKVALSADGSVLAVGDRTFYTPTDHESYSMFGNYNSGRAFAYFNCEFANITVAPQAVSGPICAGQTSTLSAAIQPQVYVANGTVNWYANVDDTTPIHTGTSYETASLNQTTSFWVEGVSAIGCPSERVEVVIAVSEQRQPNTIFSYAETCSSSASVLPVLEAGFTQGGVFSGTNGLAVEAQTGAVNASLSLPGTYTIVYEIAENQELCQAAGSFQTELVIKACEIQKGISANGDGINDNFDLTSYNVQKLQVFNRYGVKVYSQSNYTDEWFGQSDKGDELPDGTYYYVMDRNNEKSLSGWIYINRAQ